MKHNNKIGILNLGCCRNLVDSETISGRLKFKGYPIVDMGKADIGIVNTCSFIDDARQESVNAILDLIELKKEGALKKIIVYGCMVERHVGELRKNLPEVDAFIGRISFPAKLPKEQAGSRLVSGDGRENHDCERFAITPKHYAYLKICEGCLNRCSFCIIPKIKGRFASLDMDSIIHKVEKLDKEGIFELNIIGQDITGYGIDLYARPTLTELLKRILKAINHIGWIRLLYLYPNRITEDLLNLMASEPKICKYIDLPVQHINDRILKLMNRNTTKKEILCLIEKIRDRIPGVCLRTSVITGFPSETDKEFKELLKFIKEARFERLGAFIYSREPGTPAFGLSGQIPQKLKRERFDILMNTQQEVSREVNKRFLDKSLDVLIDEKDKDFYLGRTEYDAPEVDGLVYVRSRGDFKPGDFVKVRMIDTLEYDLVGEANQ
jgi:ribosomal protein S12 methylthiotransferase